MAQNESPTAIVDRQLDAYNARDIDAYCRLFASDAVLSNVNSSEEFARGIDALRAFYTERFREPRLHCQILGRMQIGDFVIDHEKVDGIQHGPLEVVAIYEVHESLITAVRFIRS